MNGMNWDLDELVAKVMGDLRKASSAQPVASTAAAVSQALSYDFANAKAADSVAAEDSAVNSNEIFEVAERVVVEDTVIKLAKATTLKVWRLRPDAIVTPSAYDELAKRGVTLASSKNAPKKASAVLPAAAPSVASSRVTYSASNVAPGVGSSVVRANAVSPATKSVQVLLATCLEENERAPQAVAEYLFRNTECTEERLDCMKKTTKLVAESLAASKSLKTVIVTHHGAVGSVWANRQKGVRAVVAFSVDQAKRDLKAANANTLILDPRDVGPYQARQVVDFFVNMK